MFSSGTKNKMLSSESQGERGRLALNDCNLLQLGALALPDEETFPRYISQLPKMNSKKMAEQDLSHNSLTRSLALARCM